MRWLPFAVMLSSAATAKAQPIPDGVVDVAPTEVVPADAAPVDSVSVDAVPLAPATASSEIVPPVDAREHVAEPPLSSGRLAREALGGIAVGAGGVIPGALLGFAAARALFHSTGEAQWGDLLWAFGGAGVGYLAGVSLGGYLAGRGEDQRCSGPGALVGSFLGVVPGLVLTAIDKTSWKPGGMVGLEVVLVLGGPVAGSMIGCNLGRRYTSSHVTPAVGSLVQLRDGHVELGIPVVMRGRIHDTTMTNVPLFTGTF